MTNVLVAIKRVPDSSGEVLLTDDAQSVDGRHVGFTISDHENCAVETAVQARTVNNGQSCIAAKRFILDQRIAEAFERRFIERMSKLKVGDPLDESTDIGPLATAEGLETLEEQVESGILRKAPADEELLLRPLIGGEPVYIG